MWLVAFGACGRGLPLSEVEIVGGSPEAVEVVRQELDAFDRAVGRGRLRIHEVRLKAGEAFAGATRRPSFTVSLDESLPEHVLRAVTRHELCHALDYREDLAAAGSPLLDELADGALDPESGVYPPDWAGEGKRSRRGEALALFCELGPVSARAMAAGECGEPSIAADIGRWLLDEVWTGETADLVPAPSDDPFGSYTAEHEIDWMTKLAPTTSPDVLALYYGRAGEDGEERWVDIETGQQVPQTGTGFSECCPPHDPNSREYVVLDRVGTEDGVGAALVHFWLQHLGMSGLRLLWFDGDWHAVEGCARDEQAIFTVEGEVWTGWVDGRTVGWVPFGP